MRLTIPFLKIQIRLSFWFFALFAFFTLLVERHILLWYIAMPILVHELGHLIAMIGCSVKIREIDFTPVSLRIRGGGQGLSYGKELIVALGGVTANLGMAIFLWLFAFQSMRTMLLIAANLAVAAFNTMPVGGLDGGRVVSALCARYLAPETARLVPRLIGFAALAPLAALSIFLIREGGGNFTLALICGYLAIQMILREWE